MAAPMQKVLPTGKLIFERTSFLNENEKHEKYIINHSFNSSVGIFLPQLADVPKALENMLDKQLAYCAEQIPLHILTDLEFIKGFIKAGSLCMLTYGTCIDTDDCVAVSPAGSLVMSLCKDTYQQCGLDGHPSKAGADVGKFVVEVDLKSEKFYPGMKYYDRVKWCLTQMKKFDFLLTWIPYDGKVCPSSIQNYFKSQCVQCKRLKTSNITHKFENFKIPIIDAGVISPGIDEASCSYDEIFEWLGACAVGVDSYQGDDYISTYACPNPNKQVSNCVSGQYEGIIHPLTIQEMVHYLRKFIGEKKLPWCCVTVHGFVDTPLSWLQDHGFYSNGDNIYSLLMFPNEDYWLYTAIGGNDVCP